MATIEDPHPAVVGRPLTSAPYTLSWGAIFGGAVAALGVGVLLHSLGLALGLTSINPQNLGSVRGSGLFLGIWGLFSSLVALFVGGFVAARGAGAFTRPAGVLHGLVMWGLTVIAGVWLMGNIASAAFSGVAQLGKAAGDAVAGIVGEPSQRPELMTRIGITSSDVIAPLNERLRAEGKPQITPVQLQMATRDVVQQGVRQGKLDREQLVQAIAGRTALTRADANELASRMQAKFEASRGELQTTALGAVEKTGKAVWAVFGALFLGLIAALAGAITAAPRRARPRRAEKVTVVEREPPPHRPGEDVYP
jgi:hypothetical protein